MSEKKDTLVQVEHLKKYFPIKGVKGPGVQAVEDISIEVKEERHLVWQANPVVEKQHLVVPYYSYIIRLPEKLYMMERRFLKDKILGKEMKMEFFIR